VHGRAESAGDGDEDLPLRHLRAQRPGYDSENSGGDSGEDGGLSGCEGRSYCRSCLLGLVLALGAG
jgi:hypothetical protein